MFLLLAFISMILCLYCVYKYEGKNELYAIAVVFFDIMTFGFVILNFSK